MRHFFESLEREINFQKEYDKLERMIAVEGYSNSSLYPDKSVDTWIEINFRKWKKRQNYISFTELRKQLNFPLGSKQERIYPIRKNVQIYDYFLFSEMIINIINGLHDENVFFTSEDRITHIIETIQYNVEKAGFTIQQIDGQYMIVEKDATAIEVADIVPELSNVIIEYNHYILKGDLVRKQELLKKIADAIEPKKRVLQSVANSAINDFSWMVNKMNVRHNNCDPSDSTNYNKAFAELTPIEQEEWYDKIYSQALMLFVILEHQKRKEEIQVFKRLVESRKKKFVQVSM